MIECVFISVGTVFGILGILKTIQQIHKAIFIDRVPRWELEGANASAKTYETWYVEETKRRLHLYDQLEALKAKRK